MPKDVSETKLLLVAKVELGRLKYSVRAHANWVLHACTAPIEHIDKHLGDRALASAIEMLGVTWAVFRTAVENGCPDSAGPFLYKMAALIRRGKAGSVAYSQQIRST